MANPTVIDQIIASLAGLGFTTGTVMDRERARLVAATGKDKGYTLIDLYKANNERPRLDLESVNIITPAN